MLNKETQDRNELVELKDLEKINGLGNHFGWFDKSIS